MNDVEFHQMTEQIANSIIYGYDYYVAIVINLLFMYKTVIRRIIRERLMIARDLVLIVSWGYIMFVPILNEALAFFMFFYGFVGYLKIIEHKKIFDFRKNK